MGYIERSLAPGETLVYKTGYHWIVMFWSLLGGLILGVVGFVLLAIRVMGPRKGGSHPELIFLGVAALLSAVAVIAGGIIRRASTEVALSNKRVLIKTGLFSRKSIEVLLPKVESIVIDETIVGRMLGYGTVVIRGTGGTFETFGRIRQPNEFRRRLQGQISGASVG